MATQTATSTELKNFYAGGVNSPSAQKMLARINKTTKEKPLRASQLKGQYPNRVARMLATLGLVKQERRDDLGIVFFPKPTRTRRPKAQEPATEH